MNPIYELKQTQKELASKIREFHDEWDSYTFRHNHIAYCELRGRTRDQIEKPADNNEPNERLIDRIKNEYDLKIREWQDSRNGN